MSTIDWAAIREDALQGFTLAELPASLELPALPYAVSLFLDTVDKPDVKVSELAQILQTDTGLTIELLRHVNSAFVGMRNTVQSVQQAISLLGLKRSKTFVLSVGMQAAVRAKKSKLINQSCFWNASLQKALFARVVAELIGADAEVTFAGALMQDFLLPVITNHFYDDYADFVTNRARHQLSISDFERERFGWDHALAAASLAHRWFLPDEYVCCILLHHSGLQVLAHPELKRSPIAATSLSALLPDQLRQFYQGLELLVKLQSKWGAFDLRELAMRVDELHEGIGMDVQNDFPLLRRCQAVLETLEPETEPVPA